MMDTLWRLVWALPLVLLTGAAVMLLLKQFVRPVRPTSHVALRMTLRESMSVADDTRVHLIEADGQTYLLVESPGGTVLQPTQPKPGDGARLRGNVGPPWARRLLKAASR
jgi:flagellar biogenesis protein FliO